MNKDVLAPQLRGFVSGVIDTPSKGVSRYTLAVLLVFTLALSACGGADTPPVQATDLPFVGEPLAVAFINRDGLADYSATDDILIAGLYDTNEDGEPSGGDTVRFGQYPLGFVPLTPTESFVESDHVIAGVARSGAEAVTVSMPDTLDVSWINNVIAETFEEIFPIGEIVGVEIVDSVDPRFCDKIEVTALSIGLPKGSVDELQCDSSDNDF